ncbi:MAG: ABC transporter substrate-binding protein [Chloroflexota bacterium]|nr:ABC transporter substrate-binding protein [Chloroflexota bacterium]
MKRTLAFLAILLLALGLAACGGGTTEGPEASATPQVGTTATPSGGTVEISFWHAMTAANQDTLKALTDRFNASQDEVKVKLQFQGNYEENLNKLLAARGGGNVPALIQLDEASIQRMVDSGLITPVQEFIDRERYDLSDFIERIISYYTLKDTLYGMPFNVSNPILYYNKLDFLEVGLDPERPPRTLDEVRQYCDKLTIRESSGRISRRCISLEIGDGSWYFEEVLVKYGALYVNNGNGRDARASEAVFNGPEGREFFQWWHDLVTSGQALNVGRNPDGSQHFVAMGAHQVSMTIGTSAALRSIFNVLELGQVKDVELGTGPLPGIEGSSGGTSPGGGVLWILKDRPQAEQEAAWKYIKYLVDPQQQADWYAGSGYFPIRRSAYDLPAAKEAEAKYPHLKVAPQQFLETPPDAMQGPLVGPFVAVRELIRRAIEQTIQGSDPTQVLDAAARQATEEIQEYAERVGD